MRERLELVVLLTGFGHADVSMCVVLVAVGVVVRAVHVVCVARVLAGVMTVTVDLFASRNNGLRNQCRWLVVVLRV